MQYVPEGCSNLQKCEKIICNTESHVSEHRAEYLMFRNVRFAVASQSCISCLLLAPVSIVGVGRRVYILSQISCRDIQHRSI